MEKLIVKFEDLVKISDSIYEIPKTYYKDMKVPARIFINEDMLGDVLLDDSLIQIVNVASLPGIVKYALAMPDIHQGYGFPIGGVAAFDIDNSGIISPGGIGYDINCGVRLLVADILAKDIKPYLEELATEIFNNVPSGVGRGGRINLKKTDMNKVLHKGASYMLELGYGIEDDILLCEENGSMTEADASFVSDKAKDRGKDQLGTLGSGNHFLEIQEIVEIYDQKIASLYGLEKGMVTVMIHCGSRGLGHQVCTDYIRKMLPKLDYWKMKLVDKELACAPFYSDEAQQYYKAMCAAANFAWANRHTIAHWTRQVFSKLFRDVNLKPVYDLSHNIGKKEQHLINGETKNLILHRKGATRAFGPGRIETPKPYRHIGHPVLIPGTMGTSSYVLVGTDKSLDISFGSSCHGAGRKMSRMKAKKTVRGSTLRQELQSKGIVIKCESDIGIAEEAPIAYKDVDNVINVIEKAGIANKVARVSPLAVVKGG